jgi:small-conductance mechanosensitive channel
MIQYFEKHPESTITVLVTLLIAFIAARLIRRGLIGLVKHGHLSPLMGTRLRGVLRWVLVFAVGLALLQQTGVFRQAWAVISAAAAALAVGFVANWSVLSNATAAVLILVFKPFRIGDRIVLRDQDKVSVQGIVTDMSLMFVTVTTDEGEFEHFPANMIFQRVVRVTGASTLPSEPGTFFERRTLFEVAPRQAGQPSRGPAPPQAPGTPDAPSRG